MAEENQLSKELSGMDTEVNELDEELAELSAKLDKAKKKSVTKGSRADLNKLQASHESQKTQLESYIEEDLDESITEELNEKTSESSALKVLLNL